MDESPARPWWLLAACYGSSVDFFATDRVGAAIAKAVCAECPVIEYCREAGMSELWGIWGGMTASARLEYRKRRREERWSPTIPA